MFRDWSLITGRWGGGGLQNGRGRGGGGGGACEVSPLRIRWRGDKSLSHAEGG